MKGLWDRAWSASAERVLRNAALERFEALSAGLGERDWTLLGAIACEQALPESVLQQLSPDPRLPLGPWLKQMQAAGLLVSLRSSRSGTRQAYFVVAAEHQQLVLRRLAETGELEAIAGAMRALLTVRSVSDLTLTLQQGKLGDFQRRFAARKNPFDAGPSTRADWLRQSLCQPFDPEWLERVWQGDALRVASLVLEECLIGPVACDELYAWLEAQSRSLSDPGDRQGLRAALYQHAILRGTLERVPALVEALPDRRREAFSVAVRVLEGNLPEAPARLDSVLSAARSAALRGPLPDCAALAPLYALLLCARDTDAGRSAAKRLLGAASAELNRGALRALRTLLRHLSEAPE